MFSFADFVNIDGLRYLDIISCSVIFTFIGIFLTCWRTASIHLPAALITLCEMFITSWVGAVDHFSGLLATVKTS